MNTWDMNDRFYISDCAIRWAANHRNRYKIYMCCCYVICRVCPYCGHEEEVSFYHNPVGGLYTDDPVSTPAGYTSTGRTPGPAPYGVRPSFQELLPLQPGLYPLEPELLVGV